MVDVVDKKTRSRMMSGIRSKNTQPEILTRKALHAFGYRYSLSTKIGRIRPDIVFPSRKVAIFVHGCYWHQHENCKLAYSDRNYSVFWRKKFRENKNRDGVVVNTLLDADWRVAVVWECVTRNPGAFTNLMNKLDQWIRISRSRYFESNYRQ